MGIYKGSGKLNISALGHGKTWLSALRTAPYKQTWAKIPPNGDEILPHKC